MDGNGNVMALINVDDSSVAGEYEYGPFNETIKVKGQAAKDNPIRYSTQYWDEKAKILFYPLRPLQDGRWMTRDPLGENANEPNLMCFVQNDPINDYDPFGLASAENQVKFFTPDASGRYLDPNVRIGNEIDDIAKIRVLRARPGVEAGFTKNGYVTGLVVGGFRRYFVTPCEIHIVIWLEIRSGFPETVPAGTINMYTKHTEDGRWDRKGSLGPSVPEIPRGAVLAHEMGHAQAYWDKVRLELKRGLAKFIGRRVGSWDEVERAVRQIENRRDLVRWSEKMANDATVNYYDTRTKWQRISTRRWSGIDFAWQKK